MRANYQNGVVHYSSHNISIQKNDTIYFAFVLVRSLFDIKQTNNMGQFRVSSRPLKPEYQEGMYANHQKLQLYKYNIYVHTTKRLWPVESASSSSSWFSSTAVVTFLLLIVQTCQR